jgi:hypothetical protein
MPRRTLNEVAAHWSTRQADIAAAIAGLAESVARLALHIKLTVAVSHAIEVERAAEALRAAAECPPALIRGPGFSGDTVDAQAPIVTTSPTDDLNVSRYNLERIQTELADPEGDNHEIESEIASGILNLQERIGSFLKP